MKHHRVDLNRNVWKTIPYGIPIGSRASKLVSSTGKLSESVLGYAEHLAMNRYAGRSVNKFRGSSATRRGNEMEASAASWYERERDLELSKCGFFTDDVLLYGASPDRLVGQNGLVEIKCQNDKGHIESLGKVRKNEKAPASYYPQAQMELMVSEHDWLDLVLFHPNHPSTIVRILPDLDFHKKLKTQIEICINHRDSVFEKLLEKPWEESGLTSKQLRLLNDALAKNEEKI